MEISPEAPVRIFGLPMEGFNMHTLYNSWVVMGVLVFVAWIATRSLRRMPGRFQAACEGLVGFFEDICNSTLGEKYGRKYLPFVATIFLFVMLSNVIGTVPNVLFWLGWPGFKCPTQDLNTPLALAFMVMCVVQVSGMKVKGFRGWLWGFFEPAFPGGNRFAQAVGVVFLIGALIANYFALSAYYRSFDELALSQRWVYGIMCVALGGLTMLVTLFAYQLKRVPNVLMAPLNFVGELGKAISHPFRLYGNIFGGFVILIVLSQLIMYVGFPPILWFLYGFFGIFVGIVQAFVFAMLALAYTAVAIGD